MGELLALYAAADVAFVGGSLVKQGGHNILEPAGLGKPVMFGPSMDNFREEVRLLEREQAATQVGGESELRDTVTCTQTYQ